MASIKKNVILSTVFAAYALIVLFILDPFLWLPEEVFTTAIVSATSMIFVLTFLLFQFFERILSQMRFVRMYHLPAVIIAPIATGFLTYDIFSGEEYPILYISSFILVAIPAAAVSILYSVFDALKNKIYLVETKSASESEGTTPKLKLKSDQGKIFLEVSLNKVICFEANDNYVVTHYLNDANEKVRSTDRISLKRISESLEELHVGFERVHKSFLVNPSYVEKVTGKSQAYKLNLQHLETEIPVSRKFDISVFSA